jgi:hypothetical protein
MSTPALWSPQLRAPPSGRPRPRTDRELVPCPSLRCRRACPHARDGASNQRPDPFAGQGTSVGRLGGEERGDRLEGAAGHPRRTRLTHRPAARTASIARIAGPRVGDRRDTPRPRRARPTMRSSARATLAASRRSSMRTGFPTLDDRPEPEIGDVASEVVAPSRDQDPRGRDPMLLAGTVELRTHRDAPLADRDRAGRERVALSWPGAVRTVLRASAPAPLD